MKQYRFEIIIREGSDEFWESFASKTGCDEVTEEIRCMLDNSGFFNAEINLVEYTKK